MSGDIKLKFLNKSNDANGTKVVLFQKNVNTDFNELAVAWKVIENCSQNSYHPFVFPMEMSVNANDSWGNFTQDYIAHNGDLFHMVNNGMSGNVLSYAGPSNTATEVQVRNDLTKGAIGANIYKGGRLLSTKRCIAPSQKAVFQLKPALFVGAASEVVEGKEMSSAVISDVNTELALLGISSADLVMTGGGPGKSSVAFQFTLENIKLA